MTISITSKGLTDVSVMVISHKNAQFNGRDNTQARAQLVVFDKIASVGWAE